MKWPKIADYPKTIVLNKEIWSVGFYRECPIREPKSQEYWGLCRPEQKMILMKLGDTAQGRCETFVHELLHALGCAYKCKITHAEINRLEKPLARFLVETGFFYTL